MHITQIRDRLRMTSLFLDVKLGKVTHVCGPPTLWRLRLEDPYEPKASLDYTGKRPGMMAFHNMTISYSDPISGAQVCQNAQTGG